MKREELIALIEGGASFNGTITLPVSIPLATTIPIEPITHKKTTSNELKKTSWKKLTPAKVLQIRKWFVSGKGNNWIADRSDCQPGAIQKIRSGLSYRGKYLISDTEPVNDQLSYPITVRAGHGVIK